jgi:hypothetical protein
MFASEINKFLVGVPWGIMEPHMPALSFIRVPPHATPTRLQVRNPA